jgi:hypothetical protein
MNILNIVALVIGILAGICIIARGLFDLIRVIRGGSRKAQDVIRNTLSSLKANRWFWVLLGVVIGAGLVYWVTYPSGGDEPAATTIVLSYEDFHHEDVTVNKELDKAIIYGSMSKGFRVPHGKTQLTVEITIPSDGWGEGLAGTEGSSAEIKVDDQVKYETITADLAHHHGYYYKYESGDKFSNSYDVTGKDNIVLTIEMVSGAHMDFKKATLTFD